MSSWLTVVKDGSELPILKTYRNYEIAVYFLVLSDDNVDDIIFSGVA